VLVHQALHDGLTGLANRAQFLSRIEIAVSRHQRHGETSAVIFLDLDGFKPINDQYGHAAGDRVLVEVARRLKAVAQRSDVVARLGGDEFVILCEDTTAAGARHTVEQIRVAVAEPIEIAEDAPLTIGISVGVATADNPAGTSADDLLRDADTVMYADKAARNAARPSTIASRARRSVSHRHDLALAQGR
jgi:diguanylate cyclase (GGDEF)-like protein